MDIRATSHPSADKLRGFGIGQLEDAEAVAVMSHLDSCLECQKAVAAVTGNYFLDRLREAHSRSGTPLPGKSLSELARSLYATIPPAALGPTVSDLPSELANHPQYEVVSELGRGGMGVVYLARHRLSGRHEVLKVMNKELMVRSGSKERFLREIQSAAMLDHPNVVKMYTAMEMGDLMVLVMEYVKGKDLAKLVKAKGRLPVPNACFYVHQTALGLQHAFDKKMVHRDIKPLNLMLAKEGKKHIIKVLDFGLAKVARETGEQFELTGQGQMLGTPDYVAPEQTLDATNADIRADIYSLGCTLYYLLTGHAPFKGKSLFEILQAHQSMEAPSLGAERPEISAELAAIVAKMMAKDPAKRYQQPIQAAQALAPFTKSKKKSKRTTKFQPAKKKMLIAAGALAAILFTVLIGLWAAGVLKGKAKEGSLIDEVNAPNGVQEGLENAKVSATKLHSISLTTAELAEATFKQNLKLMSDGTAILKSVKDEASAKAALPKLKAIDEGMAVQLKAIEMFPDEEQKQLQSKYKEAKDQALKALGSELKRIDRLPEAKALLKKDAVWFARMDKVLEGLENGYVGAAEVRIFQIDTALQVYNLQKDGFPKNLKALTEGKDPPLNAESLTDPWGKPYLYDPAGPKNKGNKPDVWTVTPDEKVIGNWKDDKR